MVELTDKQKAAANHPLLEATREAENLLRGGTSAPVASYEKGTGWQKETVKTVTATYL